MARLRYVKSAEQMKQAADRSGEQLESTVRSIRAVYETDAALVAAVLPKPLEPVERPEVCVTLSHVTMHITPDFDFEIGSGVFGVKARYDGIEGIYLITMPMTNEAAVVSGRETYGEPKKIAEIDFEWGESEISGVVRRMGIPYIELRGRVGESIGERSFVEHAYCYKALPACKKGGGFDGEPLLVRLEWKHEHESAAELSGEVVLRESAFDPVIDLPVRRLVRMELEKGTTQSSGQVVRPVPGDWLLPFLHQRYDDPTAEGIEVDVEP